jgi:hypothetical protein
MGGAPLVGGGVQLQKFVDFTWWNCRPTQEQFLCVVMLGWECLEREKI